MPSFIQVDNDSNTGSMIIITIDYLQPIAVKINMYWTNIQKIRTVFCQSFYRQLCLGTSQLFDNQGKELPCSFPRALHLYVLCLESAWERWGEFHPCWVQSPVWKVRSWWPQPLRALGGQPRPLLVLECCFQAYSYISHRGWQSLLSSPWAVALAERSLSMPGISSGGIYG